MEKREYQVCSNCVMDTTDSQIKFDEKGMCDHCHNFYENILPSWHTDERGKAKLEKQVSEIKRKSKNKEYDCIIGLSGGVDSSYLAYYAKEVLGLRVLLYSVDTGWNLNVAVENVEKITKGLGLELCTEIINWSEMKDLQLAFFKSQVPYQDIPQDHIIFASLYNYAVKHKIKYVLTGGNYSTECVREPIEWVYQNDLKQIKDIHKKFGTKKLNNLPFCSMFKYKIYYRFFKGMKVYRPLDLIPYTKEDAIKTLNEKFNWQPYANKHFESVFTRFYEGYWLVKKFGFDKRRAHFSSLILTKQLDRNKALEILKNPPYSEAQAMEDLEYICKKLSISKDEFLNLMNQENKSYKDYKSSAKMISLAVKLARVLGIEKRQYR
ncbi:MAG: N-acetyl sugar amidotransferase [Bacilli bacterium]|nr:N-acetyl sugar amidotransferase [Bacilli bacterium]